LRNIRASVWNSVVQYGMWGQLKYIYGTFRIYALASPSAETSYQIAVDMNPSGLANGLTDTPCTLSWSDVSYSVTVKPTEENPTGVKHILRGVSGRCRPGGSATN
jgi:hypothetical protein